MSTSSDDRSEPTSNGSGLQSGKYRDLPHRSANEILKSHSNFAVKLSETGQLIIKKCINKSLSCWVLFVVVDVVFFFFIFLFYFRC